jgi:mono/diheme cytochrome c family protein
MPRCVALLGLTLTFAGVTLSRDARAEAPTASSKSVPTYQKDVLPLLQKHCQDCHRPGEVAPFPLLSYAQAKKRASDLATVVESHKMPPWPASTKEGGPFRDIRVLSPAEIATIADWAESGSPEGDPKDAPPAKTWPADWPLGTPDLVLTMPEPYTMNPEGRDEHRVFVVPTGLTEGKWIAAIDFKPGNPRVVHHILAAFDTLGRAKKMDQADKEPGYKVFGGFGIIPTGTMGGWAPGKRPQALPDGVGRYLPAGSDVLLQVHYHKSGKAETDATKMAIYFSKAPIDKMIRGGMILPPRTGLFGRPSLRIPAGDSNYEIRGSDVIDEDCHLTAVIPHMHWLGKDFVMTATKPDGTKLTLVKIDQWDFNWQPTYDLVKSIALPKGTKLEMLAHFDNSDKNPFNPNKPPKDAHWGEQTTDEMCIGFFQRTLDDEHRNNKPPARLLAPAAVKAAAR